MTSLTTKKAVSLIMPVVRIDGLSICWSGDVERDS